MSGGASPRNENQLPGAKVYIGTNEPVYLKQANSECVWKGDEILKQTISESNIEALRLGCEMFMFSETNPNYCCKSLVDAIPDENQLGYAIYSNVKKTLCGTVEASSE